MSADPKLSYQGLKVAELIRSGEGQDAAIERAPGLYESRAGALADARRGRELFNKVSKGPIR